MNQRLPKLYSSSASGTSLEWAVWTINDQVIVEYGKRHGKKQRRVTVCTGKNKGRSNETTAEEQALLEATRKWQKQKDRKGYSVEIPSKAPSCPIQPFIKPMLAQPIGKRKKPLPRAIWVQPKLNGHRALAMRDSTGKVRLWSRGLKEITTMGHILRDLENSLPNDILLDGELYTHGLSLQEITSRIKRYQPGLSEQICFHMFDSVDSKFPEAFFSNRLEYIQGDYLVTINTAVGSPDDIPSALQQALEQGYEGLIVRTDEEGYSPGYRSNSVLKVKQFHDSEFQIRDISKGIPHRGLDIAILHFDNFSCTSPGSMEDKDRVANNPEDYVGNWVTVKYAELTKAGVPFHPVAIGFREDL